MTTFFRQADPEWRDLLLCAAGPTLARAGCTLTCVSELVRHMTNHAITPKVALACAQLVGALVDKTGEPPGSRLVIPRLCEQYDLEAPTDDRRDIAVHGEQAMREAIDRAMAQGCAILWVDHDKDRPGGDEDGDHYVSALRVGNGDLVCADPATGEACRISLGTLEGKAGWGDRTYRIRGVRPIRRVA